MNSGKIRIEMKNGNPFTTKITCDGVVIPCTEIRISPITAANTGPQTAWIAVLVDELDLEGVEAVASFSLL